MTPRFRPPEARRLARSPDPAVDPQAWPRVLRQLLEWTGGFAGVGTVVGLLAVGVYGYQRGALPDFGGDEWFSQLVKLGLICGVLVALLVVPAVVDAWVYRAGWMADDRPRPGRPLSVAQFAHAGRQALLVIVFGCGFGAMVFYRPGWLGSSHGALWLMLMMGLGSAYFHARGWQRRAAVDRPALLDRFDRVDRWLTRYLLPAAAQALVVVLIANWLPLLDERLDHWTEKRLWWAITAFSAVSGALSAMAVLSARPTVGAVIARMIALMTLSALIAGLMAPELMRLAGLGNLPRARLLLEPQQACWVERHLADSASGEPCTLPPDAPGGLRAVDADVVSRLGAHYTLAPAGRLADVPGGRCQAVQGAASRASETALVGPSSARQNGAPRFPCVDLPRDAVKLIVR